MPSVHRSSLAWNVLLWLPRSFTIIRWAATSRCRGHEKLHRTFHAREGKFTSPEDGLPGDAIELGLRVLDKDVPII